MRYRVSLADSMRIWNWDHNSIKVIVLDVTRIEHLGNLMWGYCSIRVEDSLSRLMCKNDL